MRIEVSSSAGINYVLIKKQCVEDMYLKMVQFMRERLVKGKPNGFGTHESGKRRYL